MMTLRSFFAVLNDFIGYFRIVRVRHALSNGTMKGVDNFEKLLFELFGVRCSFQHNIPVWQSNKTAPFYRIGNSNADACENRIYFSDVIFASLLVSASFETPENIALRAF